MKIFGGAILALFWCLTDVAGAKKSHSQADETDLWDFEDPHPPREKLVQSGSVVDESPF